MTTPAVHKPDQPQRPVFQMDRPWAFIRDAFRRLKGGKR